jgi:hypothetical protein
MKGVGSRQPWQPLGRVCCRARWPAAPPAARCFATGNGSHHDNGNHHGNGNNHPRVDNHADINNNDSQFPRFAVQLIPENKAVKTVVGDLPISPLMDPAFHQARRKFTKPKPRTTQHKPTKLQRQLARNPFGTLPSSRGVIATAASIHTLTRFQPKL